MHDAAGSEGVAHQREPLRARAPQHLQQGRCRGVGIEVLVPHAAGDGLNRLHRFAQLVRPLTKKASVESDDVVRPLGLLFVLDDLTRALVNCCNAGTIFVLQHDHNRAHRGHVAAELGVKFEAAPQATLENDDWPLADAGHGGHPRWIHLRSCCHHPLEKLFRHVIALGNRFHDLRPAIFERLCTSYQNTRICRVVNLCQQTFASGATRKRQSPSKGAHGVLSDRCRMRPPTQEGLGAPQKRRGETVQRGDTQGLAQSGGEPRHIR
mmetsp:Transcript_9714/g.34496  ORF Transcript_9714/g.34496 Transcript_9714/m.34496 type:complete len:266 (-) Transcript_9714:88-885(-)